MNMTQLGRLRRLERQFQPPPDATATFLPCIQAWRHGNGPKPQFRCLDRLLWRYFCIQDKPRPMAAVRHEINALGPLIFDMLAAWEPWPIGDPIADASYIMASPGWRCIFQNYGQLIHCVQRHHTSLTFNGDLPVPYDAGEASMAGTVCQLFLKDLNAQQQADPFLVAWPSCHPHP